MIGEWMTRVFVAIGITSVVVTTVYFVVFRILDAWILTLPIDPKKDAQAGSDDDYLSVENVSKRLAEMSRIAAEDSEKLMRYLESRRARRRGE